MVEIPDLTDAEWERLVKRLTLYADSKLVKLYWRGVKSGNAPGGVRPEDLASEAIVAFLEGKRVWNQDAYPRFFDFLKGAMDSKISALVKGVENKTTRSLDRQSKHAEQAFAVEGRTLPPDKILAESEQLSIDVKRRDKLRSVLLKEIEGDELAETVFESLEAEILKPAEIAEVNGIDIADVNNAQKRLRRATNRALKKLKRT